MKRLMLLICLLCPLMVIGCMGKGFGKPALPTKELASSFVANAKVTWDDRDLTAEIKRQGREYEIKIYDLGLTNPILYKIDEKSIEISSGELKTTRLRSQLPQNTLALLIAGAIDTAGAPSNSVIISKNNLVVAGRVGNEKFELSLAEKDKKFIELSVSSCQLTVSFSNFNYL